MALPRRIIKETQRLMQDPVPGISASPDESNARYYSLCPTLNPDRYFHVIITGPDDSPFAGGLFKLELFLPEEYPMAAPKVFSLDCIHPRHSEFIHLYLPPCCAFPIC